MTSRREFVIRAATGSAVLLTGARGAARAQQGGGGRAGMLHDSSIVRDSTNLFAMDQNAARSVTLPPKPNAKPQMTNLERDALERRIHCQCGCTLDVFTCRTTDFSCQVSPAMHRDVMELVRGGYNADEIMNAFVASYGERALMAPKTSGFHLLAWITPAIALVVGGGVLAVLLRQWGNRSRAAAPSRSSIDRNVDATSDELARLEAAVRGDDER